MEKTKKNFKIILIILFFIALSFLKMWLLTKEPVLPLFYREDVLVVGIIKNEPDVRELTTKIILSADYVENKNSKLFLKEKVVLTVPLYPELQIGQKIAVEGKIESPKNFTNENGIIFDYVNFLAKDNIHSVLYMPKISILSDLTDIKNIRQEEEFSWRLFVFKKIFHIKQRFLEQIQKIMPSPEAELLGGIILGTKRSLGKKLEENFRRVGLIHIVVLSGYNVSIIAEAILRFFSFLPKKLSALLGAISIFIFSIMVGSGATVIRATIMALIALFARTYNRQYVAGRALIFSALIMIFHNPMILFYDPSFQLSFLATFGLINFGDTFKKRLGFIPEKFQLREISSATLSTQASVLPLLMNMTGELSIVAPIVNVITLQVIPITMLLGFLAGVISFINESAGIFAAFLPFLFLKYILFIVNFFAELRFAVWQF